MNCVRLKSEILCVRFKNELCSMNSIGCYEPQIKSVIAQLRITLTLKSPFLKSFRELSEQPYRRKETMRLMKKF